MCRVLEVSSSGYYAWVKRPISKRSKENDQLLIEIRRVHCESRETYGSLKIWKTLIGREISCGKHRVARLRALHGIETRRRRRFKITTNSRNTQVVAPNLINRCFTVDRPNKIWVGDVTFIATREGWLYLAVMIDLYSRKVVGWSMSVRIDKRLVLDALEMALCRRDRNDKIVHHTDRGSIYGSEEYITKLSAHQLIPSMSRKGDCYDNAVAESFFSTLKNELIVGEVYETRKNARMKVFEYIEVFYHRQRIHQALGYRTPEMVDRSFVSI